jgi:diguanylate cyclase (GGDEF)-like protein
MPAKGVSVRFRSNKSVSETTDPVLSRFGLDARALSPEILDALQILAAERDSMAARLEAAEALADRDSLTPAVNRRGFIRELHRTMSAFERYATPAAVLYIDLDGFKAVTDDYGHAAGDAVLTQVGRLFVDSVRESDIVGRLGGDEFGVILNHVGRDEAYAKAAALAEVIGAAKIAHAGIVHRIKASIGVHAIAKVEDPELAIARADEAMYADKHARRELAKRFAGF